MSRAARRPIPLNDDGENFPPLSVFDSGDGLLRSWIATEKTQLAFDKL